MKATFFLLLVSGVALADHAAMLGCRGIADPTLRLACYDGRVLAAPNPDKTRPDEASVRQQFGLEEQASATTPTLDAIESTISGHFEGWRGNTRFQLANGQVWQVSDGSSAFHNIDNPKVRIRRGALGAFYLEIEGTNRSPRVKLLQ